jgi:hypothetical protein
MSLDTKLFMGGDYTFPSISYITTGSTLISRSEDYDWEIDGYYTIEGAMSEDDSVAAFRIKNLIEVLTTLRDEIENEYVKVRLSDERPITFLTKDNDRKLAGLVSPLRETSWDRESLDPVEANLFGYHVYCTERQECDWEHDRYRSKKDAVKAAEEHKYFTGHECKIKDYQGDQLDLKGKDTEGDTQS